MSRIGMSRDMHIVHAQPSKNIVRDNFVAASGMIDDVDVSPLLTPLYPALAF